MKEVQSYQVEAASSEAFLKKIFPDEALPAPINVTFAAMLKAKTPIVSLNPNSSTGRTWRLMPTGKASSDSKSNEMQMADFFQEIANAALETYKTEPEFIRTFTGRFCSIPVSTDIMNIDRKPDILGAAYQDLKAALKLKMPHINWALVDFFIEHKIVYHNFNDFVQKVLKDLLNKAFCMLHTQDDRHFVILALLCDVFMRFSVADRGGVVHSTEFNIHQQPKLLLRLIVGLCFADPVFIGRDPNVTLVKSPTVKTTEIRVNGTPYEVLSVFWRSAATAPVGDPTIS